jgi:hypothetical protein
VGIAIAEQSTGSMKKTISHTTVQRVQKEHKDDHSIFQSKGETATYIKIRVPGPESALQYDDMTKLLSFPPSRGLPSPISGPRGKADLAPFFTGRGTSNCTGGCSEKFRRSLCRAVVCSSSLLSLTPSCKLSQAASHQLHIPWSYLSRSNRV